MWLRHGRGRVGDVMIRNDPEEKERERVCVCDSKGMRRYRFYEDHKTWQEHSPQNKNTAGMHGGKR
jgi:hypothetical protein